MALDDILLEAEEKMIKSTEVIQAEFGGIRTGKASPDLVTNLMVEAYGTHMRLKEMAAVTTPDSRLILIQPWDGGTVDAIRKALEESKLGITPLVDGKIIRLPIPPLNEERRRDLSRVVSRMGEEIKTAVRNVRRAANEDVKKLEKDKHAPLSEDAAKKALEQVQKITDETIKEIEEIVKHKEAEIMHV